MRKGGNNYEDELYEDDYYDDDEYYNDEDDYYEEEEIEYKTKNKTKNKTPANIKAQKVTTTTNKQPPQPKPEINQPPKKTTSSEPKIKTDLNSIKYPKISYKINNKKNERNDINIVIIGHVDSGKSTLMGHLLYLLGEIDKKSLQNTSKSFKKTGTNQLHFAWATDEGTDERERGVTIDVAYKTFKTKNKNVTAMDAPGHRDFIPNMITGTAAADAAILVIDSGKQAFDAGFFNKGQTKEHAILAKTLGVKEIIVVVNKLELYNWSKERFDYIKNQIEPFLINLGFDENKIYFIPISGLTGDNLIKPMEDHAHWYEGKCLLDQIDALENPINLEDAPVRFHINDMTSGSVNGNQGLIIYGKLITGVLAERTEYLILPNNIKIKIKTMSVNKEKVDSVIAGQHADLLLNLDKNSNEEINQGSILCSCEYPIPLVDKIKVEIKTLDIKTPINLGQKLFLHLLGQKVICKIKKIEKIFNEDNSTVKKNTIFIPKNFYADCIIDLENKICCELYNNIKELGRITLRAEGETVAVGFITQFV